jgi:cytochrome c oxidase assembly protein subunit 11
MSEHLRPDAQTSAQRFLSLANTALLKKLAVVCVLMFGFGYALVPMYRAICNALGINVLAVGEQVNADKNSQVDLSRNITVEFDANARGPWQFRPKTSIMTVHPGELHTVIYEIWNPNTRAMKAQSIPSYVPVNAAAHFNKLQCFCFQEQLLKAGERREFAVAFIVDDKLPKDVTNITLSYTFFEVGSVTPQAPANGQISFAEPESIPPVFKVQL